MSGLVVFVRAPLVSGTARAVLLRPPKPAASSRNLYSNMPILAYKDCRTSQYPGRRRPGHGPSLSLTTTVTSLNNRTCPPSAAGRKAPVRSNHSSRTASPKGCFPALWKRRGLMRQKRPACCSRPDQTGSPDAGMVSGAR